MINPQAVSEIRHPGPAPVKFAGQWVAWNKDQTEIVAHARSIAEVRASAIAAGYPNAIYQNVRKPGIFIGPTGAR